MINTTDDCLDAGGQAGRGRGGGRGAAVRPPGLLRRKSLQSVAHVAAGASGAPATPCPPLPARPHAAPPLLPLASPLRRLVLRAVCGGGAHGRAPQPRWGPPAGTGAAASGSSTCWEVGVALAAATLSSECSCPAHAAPPPLLLCCPAGHYVALVRTPSGQWVCFDDEQVNAVTESQVGGLWAACGGCGLCGSCGEAFGEVGECSNVARWLGGVAAEHDPRLLALACLGPRC